MQNFSQKYFSSVVEYSHSFQGQEHDDEIKGEGNSINYKYRMHDPRIGRFFAPDPLAYKFPYYSPYQFSSNSPIMAVELEGLETSVQINYTEGSIDITRNAAGQMEVTQAQLMPIQGHYATSQGGATQDLTPGGQYEVWCSDCGINGTGGSWVVLSIPATQVVQYIDVEKEVEETIPGTPPTDPKIKKEKKTTAPVSGTIKIGGVYQDPSSVSTDQAIQVAKVAPSWRIDPVKKLADPKAKVSVKITSIDIFFNDDFAGDRSAVASAINAEYGVKVNIRSGPTGSTGGDAAVFDLQVNYTVYTETEPGTPGTPDQTVKKTVTEKQAVTVSPLIITP